MHSFLPSGRVALLRAKPLPASGCPSARLLRLIAVEQQQELIAGEPRHHGAAGHALLQAVGRLAQIDVAPVVAVGVVDLLEVVQIHHQQGGTAQLSGCWNSASQARSKARAAVQAGQGIVIALVLNALLLQHRGGHILSQTHLGGAFAQDMGDTQGDVGGCCRRGWGDGKDLVVGPGDRR